MHFLSLRSSHISVWFNLQRQSEQDAIYLDLFRVVFLSQVGQSVAESSFNSCISPRESFGNRTKKSTTLSTVCPMSNLIKTAKIQASELICFRPDPFDLFERLSGHLHPEYFYYLID